MKFRPCIDIHNGSVKQIVGSSLKDQNDQAVENYVSEKSAADYASLYAKDNLTGGHIILLNPESSVFYPSDRIQAMQALKAFPGGMQIGGGMNLDNSAAFLEAGASHVIVTSYVFQNGQIEMERLKQLSDEVGREHLVLDLSCRRRGESYYIVTNRWQRFTDVIVDHGVLDALAEYCDEFLIHAVDVEGKSAGIDQDLVKLLGAWDGIPVTYAGGVRSFEDLERLKELGTGRLDVTIGSAMDLFGGSMPYQKIVEWFAAHGKER